jgi:hypothetical protein
LYTAGHAQWNAFSPNRSHGATLGRPAVRAHDPAVHFEVERSSRITDFITQRFASTLVDETPANDSRK